MKNNIHSTNERADRHCVESTLSNLVDLWRTPDVDRILAQPPTSSKPLQSRSQRCFRYLDCFDGGLVIMVCAGRLEAPPHIWDELRDDKGVGLIESRLDQMSRFDSGHLQATFKAVYLSSRVDRSQTRMPEGLKFTKLNPGTACPATWWMASRDVNQNALTFVQVEHGESPLKAVSGLMRSQNADTREGHADIPSRDLTILKGH